MQHHFTMTKEMQQKNITALHSQIIVEFELFCSLLLNMHALYQG